MNHFEAQKYQQQGRKAATKKRGGSIKRGRESLGAVQSGLPHIGDWGKGDCGSSDAVTVYAAADGTFNAHCFSCGDDCQSTDEHGVPLALSKANDKGAPSAPTATQTTAAPAAPLDDDVPPLTDYEDYPMPDEYDTAPHTVADANEGSVPASFDSLDGDVPSAIDIADIPKLKHLSVRGISSETMERFHVFVEVDQTTGEPRYCYTADYARGKATGTYERRDLVNKGFIGVGDRKRRLDLWGMDSLGDNVHTVYVTEGVFDAMAGYEIIRRAFPDMENPPVGFVSLVKGAASIESAIDDNEGELFRRFDVHIAALDDDAPGSNARDLFVERFPGAADVDYPIGCKDLNDTLQLLKGDPDAIESFARYLLDGGNSTIDNAVCSLGDMLEDLNRVQGRTYSTPWPGLNAIIGGLEEGTNIIVGAAPKVGKTTFNYNLIQHLLKEEDINVGLFDLESTLGRSVSCIAGVEVGKQFHAVGDKVDHSEEISALVKQYDGRLFAFDSRVYGVDWNVIKAAISRMVYKNNVKVFIIDPLSLLTNGAGASGTNTMLQTIMEFIRSFALKHQVAFLVHTHVKTRPTGKVDSYEMGGVPEAAEYTGSRAFQQFSQFGISLARRTIDAPDHLDNVIQIKVTMNRYYGQVGDVWCKYDPDTTRMVELPGEPVEGAEETNSKKRVGWKGDMTEVVKEALDPEGAKQKQKQKQGGGINRLDVY